MIISLGAFFLSGCGHNNFFDLYEAGDEIPYYYIAVHNLPYHGERTAADKIDRDYERLKEMIGQADEYGIKLILLFPPQWAGHLEESDLSEWQEAGHEIAARHYSVFGKYWDGYSHLSEDAALAERSKATSRPERYLGDMDDFMEKIEKISPGLGSGCINDEMGAGMEFEGVAYDICSGFANFGQPGRQIKGFDAPLKGINKFISVSGKDESETRWFTHYLISNPKKEKEAEDTVYRMRGGVFGSGAFSSPFGSESFFDWLDFLYQRDRSAEKCLTISETVSSGLLAEKKVSF